MIITNAELAPRLDALGLSLEVAPATLAAAPPPDAAPEAEGEFEVWTVHAVNFTSGTTGPAKGVLTPYLATYMGGINAMGAAGGLTPEDRWLVDSPLFHVSGQMTALACMSAGASMAIREQFAGTRYWQVVAETSATHSLLVATMANFLLSRDSTPAERAHRLRLVVLAPMERPPARSRWRAAAGPKAPGWWRASLDRCYVAGRCCDRQRIAQFPEELRPVVLVEGRQPGQLAEVGRTGGAAAERGMESCLHVASLRQEGAT